MNDPESRLSRLGEKHDRAAMEILEAELKPLPSHLLGLQNANAVWLRARAEAAAENYPGSAEAWEIFFQLDASRNPLDLLACTRANLNAGRSTAAVSHLRRALIQRVPYSFFARAEKVVARVPVEAYSELRRTRIAILGTSTTGMLVPVLGALCLRDRIQAAFYQGLYGSLDQEILDPQSGLAGFRPEIVFLVMNWTDLRLGGAIANPAGARAEIIARLKGLWSRLSESYGCHVVQHAFDYPAEDSQGYLSTALPGGRARLIETLNAELREQLPSYVSLLDTPAVQREAGAHVWEDPAQWYQFKQHPSTEALPALAEMQMAHVRAALGLNRKVLVTDLDNTLWKGVIGEDGLDGIQIGPGTAAGEAHQSLQRYLLELKSRGVLLAVCSKNNPADARLPFEKHPHMALRLDDFAAFQANWLDKASNLRTIAEKLSLGLDSFVFIDDNPLEREWVRLQIPEIAVVELGKKPAGFIRELDRGRYFFSLTLSSEDVARADQYRLETSRDLLRDAAGSLDEFLSSLQMQASVIAISPANQARVTQLTNKTNQFNVTTRRFREAQISGIAADPRGWARAFHLSDRFGDYGLIGVLFCVAGEPDQWEIDTWLMSCRVLGRQCEQFMFDRMMEAASARNVREIVGVYRPTAKNGLVADLYDRLGFQKIAGTEEEIRYRIPVPAKLVVKATHVRDVSALDAGDTPA